MFGLSKKKLNGQTKIDAPEEGKVFERYSLYSDEVTAKFSWLINKDCYNFFYRDGIYMGDVWPVRKLQVPFTFEAQRNQR